METTCTARLLLLIIRAYFTRWEAQVVSITSWMSICWTSGPPLLSGALCTDCQESGMSQNQGTDMSLDSGREDCMFWPFMYGDPPAIVVSDFNFVGNASALIKKGAKQSFIDINAFRDIF